MIEFSSSFKLNEIHIVDSRPFNEDPKNIFSREALISGEGWPENLGKITTGCGETQIPQPKMIFK